MAKVNAFGRGSFLSDQKSATAIVTPPAILIKKYANRRLYDMTTSRYITLSELSRMVREGTNVRIEDAKTGQDLTRLTFIQIIQELEQDATSILPTEALRQIILVYGSGNEPLLTRYLERTMSSFTRHHILASTALESAMDAISNTDGAQGLAQPEPVTQDQTLSVLTKEIATLRNRVDNLEGDGD